ncbi:alpha/beta family hydrolase [Chloroflexota bacterium]
MYPTETLTINGYQNEPVPHSFYRQETDTDHLAIILPGRGYTAHMPLLFYPASLMVAQGADVLRVEYDYSQNQVFQSLAGNEQFQWLFADVTAAYQVGLAQRDYQQVTLIGKSLGTPAMGHLLTTQTLPAQINAIWLTPLVRFDSLRQQIKKFGGKSLFVIGTADPHYDTDCLAEVQQATGGQVVTIDEADHGLMIEGDIVRSVQGLEQVMRAMEAFLS